MGIFVFMVIAGVIAVVAIVLHNRKVKEAWANSATKLRLDFSDGVGGRSLNGRHGEIYLEIKTEVVGKSTWTSFRAEFPESLPFPLRLRPQTFFATMGNAVRNRIDLETGDSWFDPKVIVESTEPEQAREFLDKQVRGSVMKLNARFDEFDISEDRVAVKKRRLVSSVSELVEDVRLLETSTRDIWDSYVAEKRGKPIPPPLPTKEERPEAVVADTEEVTEEEGDITVVALPETGAIKQASEERNPSSPLEVVATEVSAPEEEEDSPEPITVAYDPLFAHHCREILSECRGRYEMKKQFEKELLGSEVDDRFILKSEEPFSMHKVFGRGPGRLRTFSLGDLPDGNELLLIADTDSDGASDQRPSNSGELDAVEGSLVSFDPFSHTLFLRTHREEAQRSA